MAYDKEQARAINRAERQKRAFRLARYDEAIRLLREYESEWSNPSTDLLYRRKCRDRLFDFLAAEPKVKP